jgi:YidC/Oxa1 family membrane protein insertase
VFCYISRLIYTLSFSHFLNQLFIFFFDFQCQNKINIARNFSQFNQTTVTKTTPVILLNNKNYDFHINNIRYASSETTNSIDSIPEPPQVPEIPIQTSDFAEKATETAQALAEGLEPSFASIGLGGWTPVGIVQNFMEFVHVGLDVPWWGTILIGTICVRTIIFPLVIMAQRNGAKLSNNMPQLTFLQTKMSEARQSGNAVDAARYSQAIMEFMKEKQVNPLKNMIVPLAQAPIFISFFIGLRQMANTPVESMREGGLFWFTDLTVCDQFYLLPIITSLTMLATIEVGTDSARLNSQNMGVMKYILRALPFVILPFTINFPGAIVTYWTFSNIISLIQVSFLRIPSVRDFFKIERLIKHSPSELQQQKNKKGFVGGLKDSWTNMKITRELEERKRIDEIMFQKAAKGAIQKTYKYDPTKPTRPLSAIEAKKR